MSGLRLRLRRIMRSMETSSRFRARSNRRGRRTIAFTGSFFRRGAKGAAVMVLAQWNARWEEQQSVCRWLNRLGITAIKMSLPYHDRRAGSRPSARRSSGWAEHRADDSGESPGGARRAPHAPLAGTAGLWAARESSGSSIGSCIGFITMCHEPALRAGAFLHVSTYFGEVVAHGLTTMNVWESMKEALITPDEARHYWSPISPFPYIPKAARRGEKDAGDQRAVRSNVLARIYGSVFGDDEAE